MPLPFLPLVLTLSFTLANKYYFPFCAQADEESNDGEPEAHRPLLPIEAYVLQRPDSLSRGCKFLSFLYSTGEGGVEEGI